MRRAQSMSEYAVLIAIFAAAILLGQTYVKKAITGRLKSSGDSISSEPFGKDYTENSWSQSSAKESTGVSSLTDSKVWNKREFTAKDLDVASDLGLEYVSGQAQFSTSEIEYNLKRGGDTIFNE